MTKPSSGECDVTKLCPVCGTDKLILKWWLEAKPIGTFSLAGAQFKFSAFENAVVQCRSCKMVLPGRITEDAVVVDGKFVSGHFESAGRVVRIAEAEGLPDGH